MGPLVVPVGGHRLTSADSRCQLVRARVTVILAGERAVVGVLDGVATWRRRIRST